MNWNPQTRLKAPIGMAIGMSIGVAIVMSALCGTTPALAATVLAYEIDGRCETDFDRMTFDGLQARVDSSAGGSDMSTLFDDSEQMMYLLMHDSRNVMTLESDDDAVDFQSDVGRSATIYAGKQVEKLTGIDSDGMMAQAHAAQVAMCPELANIGFSDPDYAAAAERCAETASKTQPADMGRQRDLASSMLGRGSAGRSQKPASAPAAPVRWSTTTTEADGSERQVAGMTCRNEVTRRGDTVLREQCMIEVDAMALDAAALRRIKRIVKVGEGMSAGITSLNPDMNPDAGKPARIALQRTCYDGGKRTGQAVLQIDRDTEVAPALFEVPAGYEALDMSVPGDE